MKVTVSYFLMWTNNIFEYKRILVFLGEEITFKSESRFFYQKFLVVGFVRERKRGMAWGFFRWGDMENLI